MNVPDERIKTCAASTLDLLPDNDYCRRYIAMKIGNGIAAKLLEFNKIKIEEVDGQFLYSCSLSIIVPK